MSGVSEPELSEIYGRLQEHVASGGSPLGHLLHNPGNVLRAVRAIAALPVLEARFSAGPDGRALRAVFREGRVRFGRWEHRAVVVLPDRVEDVGSGRPNRTLRRQVRHATAAGLRCETVDDPDERRRLVALADEWERSQPGAYRNPDADNGDLVRFDLWLAVYSAEGLPLLLSVAPVDGGWGCVRYFRTLAPGPDRSGARYLAVHRLQCELVARGVRYLVDNRSPVGLPNGLRHFQRMVGFRLHRVRVRPEPAVGSAGTAPGPRGPLRVLHVLGRIGAEQGGSAAAAVAVARTTRAAGDRATLLTTVGSPEELPGPEELGDVDLVACPRSWPGCWALSWSLVGWLRRHAHRYDLLEVHEVFSFPALACWWAARRSGVPLVIRPHGSLEPYDMAHNHPWLKRLLRPALRRLLEDCAAVWLTAQRESANLAGLGAAPCTVVTALPVDAPSSPGDGAGFRASLGLTAQARIVLFLGRLDRKKGLIRLVEAVDRVRAEDPRAVLVVAGSGDPAFATELRSRVAGLDHPSAVHLVGYLGGQRKRDALAAADLFVLHSDNENFGIAPVEAVQAGLPVLVSDEVYVGDDLAAAGVAVVVPAGDSAALSCEIAALLADPARRATLAAAAGPAASRYLPDRVARRDARVRRAVLAGTVDTLGEHPE